MNRKIIYVDNFLTGHGQTPTTGTTLVKLFKNEGYTVIQTSKKQNKALRLFDMLFTISHNRLNSVVVIATYSTSAFYFAWMCGLCCRLFYIPYIPCLHGGNLPDRIKGSPKKALQLFGNSYINVSVSGYLHKSMIDHNWNSLVIPNNISIGAYPFRQRTNCAPAILWVRSFHQIYNPTLGIRILYTLLKTYPGATLTMVGPDKDGSLQQCKALAKELEVDHRVSFTGLLPREQWVALAAKCDIFINTTNFDNLPVSVVEAMALGLITISTNVGGVPYLIENNQNGLLVPAANEAAFVEAIFRVLNNRSLCERLSIAARTKAEEFDWANIKVLWNRLFNSIPE
ncbi:glycosyltransferase family 4 protein [Segetibacter sp.]|jgi:glycosyltransferase involved in cell wall biosynthesis|uniref:glycosyltransferase family 4 protein n=1 Tax=Segetibacter sp. TaxID=2231182 RepID=UPI00261B6F4B|nr:glycosyltransferase family 4 protein [Segetibacter sp.]MCW3078898.1 glycosyl transferase group 1 [Segetibacter sp.]